MKTLFLNNIHADYNGYQKIIDFCESSVGLWADKLNVEILSWFDANLSAALGGVLDRVSEELNTVRLDGLQDNIRIILQKNGFLAHYGYPRVRDFNDTTIEYLKLKPTDARFFNQYVMKELLQRSELPILSPDLKKKMAESIYEIFVNAQMHSESEYIYTCGQVFPQKNTIVFTICDIGIGFKNSVNKRFGRNLTAAQAIQWATTPGHTTKTEISGGIGLSILKEFIQRNNGGLQIVSNEGFYELDTAGETVRAFRGEFPGTVVTMKFNTNDSSLYGIIDGTISEDIF